LGKQGILKHMATQLVKGSGDSMQPLMSEEEFKKKVDP
jgi:hypothetical protein